MNEVNLIVQRVVDAFHPLRIIMFGSAARGESDANSDIDLLVIMPEGTARLETAEKLQMEMFGIPAAVDFLVATPSDVERNRDNIGLIYRTILQEGKELYAA
ncbi:MAG: nucleotidyltransferase domain-containing protein [Lentisphaerae bacterium]|nr:nucleotidyltransferase domain-containing protein [Lentisphaerota bacterium]